MKKCEFFATDIYQKIYRYTSIYCTPIYRYKYSDIWNTMYRYFQYSIISLRTLSWSASKINPEWIFQYVLQNNLFIYLFLIFLKIQYPFEFCLKFALKFSVQFLL